jgi:tetratricopeptide (TPR) repeat protein
MLPGKAGRILPLLLPSLLLTGPGIAVSATGSAGAPSKPFGAARADSSTRAYIDGAFLSMKGDYWGAIDRYRQSNPALPGHQAAVSFSIARAYSSLAVPDSARIHGENAVRLDPGNAYYLTWLARLVHEMRDYGHAADLYGQAFRVAPERTEYLYSQALEYVAAGRSDEALEAYGRLLQRDPDDGQYLSQSLVLQISRKRYQDAIATLLRLITVAGPQERLRMTLGELYEQTGQHGDAIALYREMIADDPRNPAARVALIGQYLRHGVVEDALGEFAAFDRLRPGDPTPSIDLVRFFALRAEKEPLYVPPVFRMIDLLARRHPRESRIYVLKGAFEMRRGMVVQASSSFDRAVRYDRQSIQAREGLVMVLLERHEFARAFREIAQARRAMPARRIRLDLLEGYLRLHSGSPAKAVVLLERVIAARGAAKEPELLIQANSSLAIACEQLGRKRQSRAAYARVLDLDPHHVLAMNNLAYLYAEDGIMLPQALRLARNAVMLEPDNPVFLDTLGWVHYRLGNYAEARIQLEKAVATGVGEPEIYLHLGKVYEKFGEQEKAREMFDKARGGGKND